MQLSKKEQFAYGFGAVGKDMVYALVSSFLMYYYNTVLGISASFVGVLFMVARILDAVNDPFMGILVEKTESRFGKFRPWIFSGTVLSAITLYAMYAVPRSLTGSSLLIYVSVAYILWCTTYTLMDIPFWSMIPAITKSGKEREKMSVVARSCAGLGFAIPTALTMKLLPILGKGDERTGFQIIAGCISIFFILASIVLVLNVKEKTRPTMKTPTIKEMFTGLLRNDQALAVVITIVIFNASLYLTSSLAVYFFDFDIRNGALFGVFGLVGGATQIISMISLPALRKWKDRSSIFVGAISISILGYLFLFLLGMLHMNNIILLSIAAIIIYYGFGLATVLTTIFLADSVDYGEWKTNNRNESVVFSMQTFVVQLASAISVFIAGIGLDLIKLDPKAEIQTEATLLGLRILMIIIPMIGLIVAILFFKKKYKLNEDYLDQIMLDMKEREKSRSSTDWKE